MSMLWHYLRNGTAQGPIPEEQLRKLITSGVLGPSDRVWHEGMEGWTAIQATHGLITVAAPRNPPPQATVRGNSSTFCSKCGSQVPDGGIYCPKCGVPVVAQATKSTEVKSAKGQGALSGLFVGMGCSVVCIIVGLSLCFTGIGAIVGIPLIIVGLCGPILGLFAGMKLVKGECPWCQTMVTCTGASQKKGGITCPACKKRIVIKGKNLIKIE